MNASLRNSLAGDSRQRDPLGATMAPWRAELCRARHDKAEQIVGRRLLTQSVPPPVTLVKQLHDIFEARSVWQNESYWLEDPPTTKTNSSGSSTGLTTT